MTAAPKLDKLDKAFVEATKRKLYSESFYDFCKAAWPVVDRAKYKDNWHIRVLCDHLQAVADGRIKRLLINVPPGSAKSTIVGVMFGAWLWTRDPSKRIISASHNIRLATRDSRKTRDLILSRWYQALWPITLSADENQKTAFENLDKGAREAMAFTSLTGSRGNIVIIDDPHSVKGAKSADVRADVVETFLEAVPTRLNDPMEDAIIVVMQRLHEEDVSGAILARPELGYDHLCIPMEAEEPKPATSIGWVDHRQLGELMFPARWDEKALKRERASLGPFAYAGQHQQRPAPAEDGFFSRQWFHRYGELCPCGKRHDLPTALHYYMTSDHAPGGKTTSDFNVFRMWGIDEKRNIWLVDSFRKQCNMDEAMGIERTADGRVKLGDTGALPMCLRWKPFGWYPEADNTWIAIRSMVRAAMFDARIFSVRIVELPTRGQGDKVGKAQAYQAMAAAGKVYLPGGPVGDNALAEYVLFPNSKHDDQVDADGAIARVIDEAMPAYIAPILPEDHDDIGDRGQYAYGDGNDSDLFY